MIFRANTLALKPGMSTSFRAQGGVEPYVYSVLPGGAGGTINSSTGFYTAPVSVPISDGLQLNIDRVVATDADGDKRVLEILVGSPIELVCDIIRREMDLEIDQVWLWNQKINIPKDSRLYVAVGIVTDRVIGNVQRFLADDDTSGQYISMQSILSIDIWSRTLEAVQRKEEVLMALASQYAQSQQEANSFLIGKQSTSFQNLSQVDGAAIPYRFSIQVAIQYTVEKLKAAPFYDTFEDEPEITTES